jgi:hypothetical protein
MALAELLSQDHDRLDALLVAALRADGTIDEQAYDGFRRGLLRHIGIEERLLFPVVRRMQGASAVIEQLHRDHAALAALLVPPPAATGIAMIRDILAHHNPLEEGDGGLYRHVETLAAGDLPKLLESVEAFPQIPVAPYSDTELLRRSTEQLVREAAEGRRSLQRLHLTVK